MSEIREDKHKCCESTTVHKCCESTTVRICSFVISLLFGLAMVGLAIAGIILISKNDLHSKDDSNDDHDYLHNHWFQLMIAALVASLPYSIFGTIALTLLVKKRRKQQTDGENKSLIQQKEINFEGDSEPFLLSYRGAELAEISTESVISLFFTLFLASLALLGILWGIAIAYDNSQKTDKNITAYVIVDIVVGMISPILMVISAALFSVFLEYITKGSLNARVIIPKVLRVVELKKTGDKIDSYWIILDRFYFKINKNDLLSKDKRFLDYCSRTPATWILTVIVSLAFVLAVSFFMGTTIMDQTTLHSCPHSSLEVDCFNTTDFNYVDCSDPEIANMTFNLLHCFRFFRFGRDSYAIGAIAGSFAFYLAILAVFTIAFYAAKVLNTFKPTIPWAGGVGCLLFSFLVFGAGIANVCFTYEIIQTFQIFVLAIYICMIAVLVLMSKSGEQKNTDNDLRAIN